MPWVEIRRACGHDESVQITGPDTRGQHDRKAVALTEKPCGPCRREQLVQARAAESAAAAIDAKSMGLPPLTGSPRQVAWAETIRRQAVDDLDTFRARMGQWVGEDPSARVSQADQLAAALDQVTTAHTTAAWWIEHQISTWKVLHREALTAITGEDTTS